MTITSREKEIIERAADALYHIAVRANNKITEHHFEKIAEMLDQILYDFEEGDEDDD